MSHSKQLRQWMQYHKVTLLCTLFLLTTTTKKKKKQNPKTKLYVEFVILRFAVEELELASCLVPSVHAPKLLTRNRVEFVQTISPSNHTFSKSIYPLNFRFLFFFYYYLFLCQLSKKGGVSVGVAGKKKFEPLLRKATSEPNLPIPSGSQENYGKLMQTKKASDKEKLKQPLTTRSVSLLGTSHTNTSFICSEPHTPPQYFFFFFCTSPPLNFFCHCHSRLALNCVFAVFILDWLLWKKNQSQDKLFWTDKIFSKDEWRRKTKWYQMVWPIFHLKGHQTVMPKIETEKHLIFSKEKHLFKAMTNLFHTCLSWKVHKRELYKR